MPWRPVQTTGLPSLRNFGSGLAFCEQEAIPDPDRVTYTYYMTSNCALADACARCEGDACKHLLSRTYADFSEKMRTPEGLTLNWP